MRHNFAKLIREQGLHKHFRTVVSGVFAEFHDFGIFHEHLIDALNDDAVRIGEMSFETLVYLVDDTLKRIFLFIRYIRSGTAAGHKGGRFFIQHDCAAEGFRK